MVFFNTQCQHTLCAWINGKILVNICDNYIFVILRMELLMCGTVHSFLCLPVKFFLQYDIVGHSGDGFDIELVRCDKVPKNNKQRLKVLKVCSLRKYYVHSFMLFPFVWK